MEILENISPSKKNFFTTFPQHFKKKYLIEIIKKKFLRKNEYYKLLKNTDIFISPRKQEGIGMSFVEAMSLGKYVIGFNDATMNILI